MATNKKAKLYSKIFVWFIFIILLIVFAISYNSVDYSDKMITEKEYLNENNYVLEKANFYNDGIVIKGSNRKYKRINEISIDKYYEHLGYTLIEAEEDEVYYNGENIISEKYADQETDIYNNTLKSHEASRKLGVILIGAIIIPLTVAFLYGFSRDEDNFICKTLKEIEKRKKRVKL